VTDPATAERLLAAVTPEVARLASLVSPAVRVEPWLLRRTRQVLEPSLPAVTEAELCFSPLVASRTTSAFVLDNDVAAVLRERLRDEPAEVLADVRGIVTWAHRGAPLTIRLEEEVIWQALHGADEPELTSLLAPALKTMVASDEAAGIARWAARALPALPVEAQESAAGRMLQAGAQNQLGVDVTARLPPDELRLVTAGGATRSIGVRLRRRSIELSEPPAPDASSIAVPATDPLELRLRPLAGQERVVEVARDSTSRHRLGGSVFARTPPPVEIVAADGATYLLEASASIAQADDAGGGAASQSLRSEGTELDPAARVRTPASVDELAEILAQARSESRRVILRNDGRGDHLVDRDEIIVSLTRLDRVAAVAYIDGRPCITVGAGARWGDILDAVEPLGLVPAITGPTQNATAGGTLCSDPAGRFSATSGSVGNWVRSFELLTFGGRRLTCTPPPDQTRPDAWTLEERAFMATIGGLGYLGAVCEITYELVRAAEPTSGGRATFGVQSVVRRYRSIEHLADALARNAQTMQHSELRGSDAGLAMEPFDTAMYATLVTRLNRGQSAVVLTSSYTTSTRRRPLTVHTPASRMGFVSELLLSTRLGPLIWLFTFHVLFRQRVTYVDDLRGFTFSMDAGERLRTWGRRYGVQFPSLRQTFVLPFAGQPDLDERDDVARHASLLASWLDESHAILREHGVQPARTDVFVIRDGPRFTLSATAGRPAVAVSHTFRTTNPRTVVRVQDALAALSVALTAYEGRVHLADSVFASEETLASMYGDDVIAFLRLKRELDPERLLEDGALQSLVGHLVDDVYAGAYDEGEPS
jgi:decaprenylphospho-beta-D-ribofuranose 2-oxidase